MKAVFFDLGGTLWAPFGCLARDEVVEAAANEAASRLPPAILGGLTETEVARRQSELAARQSEFAAKLTMGLGSMDAERDKALRLGCFADPAFQELTVEQIVDRALMQTFQAFNRASNQESHQAVGGTLSDRQGAIARDCALVFGHSLTKYSTAYPESTHVLARLRSDFPGLVLGIVSNTIIQREVIDHYLKECDLYGRVDFRVYSSSAGWRKPHPAIYALALAEAGVRAEDAVFVGDRLVEDVLGPRRLGMQAILCHDLTTIPDQLGSLRPN